MFGWVTPKRSIRFRITLKAVAIEESTCFLKILAASSSEVLKVISEPNFPKISGSPSFTFPLLISLKARKNNSKYGSLLFFCISLALSKALRKTGFLELPDKPSKISLTDTSKVAFIPPFKSKPKFIARLLTSL